LAYPATLLFFVQLTNLTTGGTLLLLLDFMDGALYQLVQLADGELKSGLGKEFIYVCFYSLYQYIF
jgi:hypothetical protein